jgi:hypothetical protein
LGEFVALREVAGSAGDHEVLGAVTAILADGEDVVDVVVTADLLSAPVAAAPLSCSLRGNIGSAVSAGSADDASAPSLP